MKQIGDFHESPGRKTAWVNGDDCAGRAAAYQVSWNLHRAGLRLKHVGEVVDRAHEVEARIAYDHRDFQRLPNPVRSTPSAGLSL